MNAEILSIVLPVAAVVVALLIVVGLWLWWSGSRQGSEGSDTARPETPEIRQAPPAKHETRAAASALSSPPGRDEQAIEVIRVLRDLADGSLIVEIDGRRYRSLQEIGDPQVGRRFLGNANALAKFARLGEISVPEAWEGAEPARPAAPPPAPAAQPPADWQPAPPAAVAPPPPVSRASAGASGAPAQRGGLFRRGKRDSEEIEPIIEPPTIAEQIEELLQERLAHNPAFAGRSIHIKPAIGGIGIRIDVDGKSYDSVSDVADGTVKEFIQATIQQWERQQ